MTHRRVSYGIRNTPGGWLWEVLLDGQPFFQGTCEDATAARLAALSSCLDLLHDGDCRGTAGEESGDGRA